MTQPDVHFRVVLRGYDPGEVDRAVSELQGRLGAAEQAAAAMHDQLQQAQSSAAAEPASFAQFGERVGQILALAEQEASSMRDQATAESEAIRKDAEQAAAQIREAADTYADQRRRDADAEGLRVLTDSRRAADEERDAAERDAAARRQEAEAIYEKQRANAAKSAADFETTLAERRQRTTVEFQEQQAAAQAQIDAMAAQIEDMKAAAERQQIDAEAEARRIVEEAEERATAVVRDARATADRVRTESDRELSAAAQRRDSINSQLSNVRQMLATLTGSAQGLALGTEGAVAQQAGEEHPEDEDNPAVEEGDEGEEDVEGVEGVAEQSEAEDEQPRQ